MSIRLRDSLHFKIAAGVIGTVVLLLTLYFAWDYRFYRRQLLSELQESASQISNVALNSLLELSMLGEHPELLPKAVENLSQGSVVSAIYIVDRRGVVRFTSDVNSRSKRFTTADEGCRDCHTPGHPPKSSIFHQVVGTEVLRHVSPIPNRRECQTCHNPQERLLGALIVDYPTAGMKAKLNSNLAEMLLQAVLTLAGILLTLGALLNRLIITRIKRMAVSVGLLGKKREVLDLSALEGPDEIGQLASSFSQMSKDLHAYYKELERKEQVRVSLLERLVHTQEDERKSISRELHDQFGASLSALLLSFQTHFTSEPDENSTKIPVPPGVYSRLESRMHDLIGEVHKLAWQMRPSILDDYGLDSALKRYIEQLPAADGLAFDYQYLAPPNSPRLPIWVEVTLYRVAQEALTNIIRHSRASRASIVLMRHADSATLIIEDDGCGFDPNHLEMSVDGGLGLKGMNERVSLCGGTLALESAVGKGTTIRVKIDLTEELLNAD